MKYFLDSAKLDEIQTAYNTFGIDGVTTNPRHIMLSGKPFLTAIQGIADWIKSEGLDGYERFRYLLKSIPTWMRRRQCWQRPGRLQPSALTL